MDKAIAIIGGGPGGYVAAIRAAKLGATVTLIEKERLGGTCLNVGCIPTKALLQSAETLEQVKQAKRMGIEVDLKGFDWTEIMKRKDQVVKQLVKGVQGLMKANRIELLEGTATFIDDHTLEVVRYDEKKNKTDARTNHYCNRVCAFCSAYQRARYSSRLARFQ